MNKRIKELARQSGATDEKGAQAATVFCFTDQELNGFAELLIKECVRLIDKENDGESLSDWGAGYTAGLDTAKLAIEEHFGVE